MYEDERHETISNTNNSRVYKLKLWSSLHDQYCDCNMCMGWGYGGSKPRSWKRYRKTQYK
jgi:hypothetical protein